MITHQHHTSEGTVADFVNITDRTINNFRLSGTCHSGVRFGSSGVLSKRQANDGLSAISGQWLGQGTASGFFVQHTIISGTLEVDPAVATFNQLNVNREYDNQKSSEGEKTTVVFFELSSDVSGVPLLDTATMTFISRQGVK